MRGQRFESEPNVASLSLTIQLVLSEREPRIANLESSRSPIALNSLFLPLFRTLVACYPHVGGVRLTACSLRVDWN